MFCACTCRRVLWSEIRIKWWVLCGIFSQRRYHHIHLASHDHWLGGHWLLSWSTHGKSSVYASKVRPSKCTPHRYTTSALPLLTVTCSPIQMWLLVLAVVMIHLCMTGESVAETINTLQQWSMVNVCSVHTEHTHVQHWPSGTLEIIDQVLQLMNHRI